MPTEDFEQAQYLSAQVEHARQRAVLAASDAVGSHQGASAAEFAAREYAKKAERVVVDVDQAVKDAQDAADRAEAPTDSMVAELAGNPISLTRAAVDQATDTMIGLKTAGVMNVTAFGAIPDGLTDNTVAFASACAASRLNGKKVYVPKGRWKIDGTVDCSGVEMFGELGGYYNRNGSVIVGGAPITFEQQSTGLAGITMKFSRLRFEGCITAIQLTYSIYSHICDVSIVDASGDAFVLGINSIIGPIWNHFERCQFSSTGGRALVQGGKDWHNNTITDDCDFKGAPGFPAVEVSPTGGYGAINNIYNYTEIRGGNVGIKLSALNEGTKVSGCYMESQGPSLWINATSRDLRLAGNIYGTTRNDNATGQAAYVYHESGPVTLRVDGGWVTAGDAPQYENMRFVKSGVPASMQLSYVTRPVVSVASAGWKLHDSDILSEASRIMGGDVEIEKHAFPNIVLRYPDGSKVFKIRRNGSQGGSDFGVYFENEGNIAFVINSAGSTLFQKPMALQSVASTARPTGVPSGTLIYDSTLAKVILRSGTSWVNVDGTPL